MRREPSLFERWPTTLGYLGAVGCAVLALVLAEWLA